MRPTRHSLSRLIDDFGPPRFMEREFGECAKRNRTLCSRRGRYRIRLGRALVYFGMLLPLYFDAGQADLTAIRISCDGERG